MWGSLALSHSIPLNHYAPCVKAGQEEIEVEIDTLPASASDSHSSLRQLPVKRIKGKGTGTGVLKRKSMDETLEADKIRKLEDRMKLFTFERRCDGDVDTLIHMPPVKESSSDDDSDSSGPESE